MTRHELNEVFLHTSFLQGANATYLAELHARYEQDPASLDPEWRAFFASLDDSKEDVLAEARGPSWARSERSAGAAAGLAARRLERAASAGRGARHVGRAHADPRLPDPRPSRRPSRPARSRHPPRASRAQAQDLRLHQGRLRPPDLYRRRVRAGVQHAQADARHPQAHLFRPYRLRVHAYLRPAAARLDPGPHRGPGGQLHPGRQEGDSEEADRGRGLRALPRREIYRHQALRPGRRRVDGAGARADHQARRAARSRRDRHRHAPSRPAERAVQRHGQALPGDLQRVQGRRRPIPTRSKARAT